MPLQRLNPETPGLRSFAVERCLDSGVLVWTVHINGQRFGDRGVSPESPSLLVTLWRTWRGWRKHKAWVRKNQQVAV